MKSQPEPPHVTFARDNAKTLEYPIDILFPSAKLSTDEVRERLSPVHCELIRMLQDVPQIYFATNRPRFDIIAIHLGMQCVESMGGVWLWEGSAISMWNKIHDMGAGVYFHARKVVDIQSKFDPMFTVIGMEVMCDKHRLNSVKCPGIDGTDLLYSHDPIPNPVFDNGLYIPALRGYYSVIGTGGAQ